MGVSWIKGWIRLWAFSMDLISGIFKSILKNIE
jgi:hypothetical protein